MKVDEESMRRFAARHGLSFEHECKKCSTIITHPAMSIEKTKDHAIVNYQPCPQNLPGHHGPTAFSPLSPTERAHWKDLCWGIRGYLEGHQPGYIMPVPKALEPSRVYKLGVDDEPFAVLYEGTCSFSSLLVAANEDWGEDDPPFCEENCRYTFVIEQNGKYTFNVDPGTRGSKFVTVAYWEEPNRLQQ